MSRHDVRCTDQERPTSNVQLSTFNGVTESAHGGQNMGTDTELWRQVSLGCSWRYCCVPIRSVSIFFWGREPGRRRRSRRRYFPARRRRDFRSMGGGTASLRVRELWFRRRRAGKYAGWRGLGVQRRLTLSAMPKLWLGVGDWIWLPLAR